MLCRFWKRNNLRADLNNPNNTKLKMHEADRTGRVMHIARGAFLEMMDTELPDDLPMVYADPKLLEAIESLYVNKEGINVWCITCRSDYSLFTFGL